MAASGHAVTRLLEAACEMDSEALESELDAALDLGSPRQVFELVVAPVIRSLGALWHAGEVSVGHEHLATECLLLSLAQLHRRSQPAIPRQLALLAAFPDELHTLPLYGVAFRLNEVGCATRVLGARTPPGAVAEVVRHLEPDLVGLSVTIPPAIARRQRIAEGYAAACRPVPWVVGGGAAEPLRECVEAAGGRIIGDQSIERFLPPPHPCAGRGHG